MRIKQLTSQLDVILESYELSLNENETNNNKIKALVDEFLKEKSDEEIPWNPTLGNRIRAVLSHFQSSPRIYQALEDIMGRLCADPLPLSEKLMVHALAFVNIPEDADELSFLPELSPLPMSAFIRRGWNSIGILGDADVTSSASRRVSKAWNRANFIARINAINSYRIPIIELTKKHPSGEVLEGMTDFICRAGWKIEYLDLSKIPITNQPLAKIQAACPNIADLTLDSPYLSFKSFESLADMKNLEALTIKDKGDDGEEALERMTDFICRVGKKIKYLDLKEILITDTQWARIQAVCPNITNLTLSSPFLSRESFEGLAKLEKLKTLAITNKRDEGNNVIPFSWSELPTLERLKIKNFDVVNLDKLSKLKYLSLNSCIFPEEFLDKKLTTLKELRSLELKNLSTNRGFSNDKNQKNLNELLHLESLSIENCNFDHAFVQRQIDLLPKLKRLSVELPLNLTHLRELESLCMNARGGVNRSISLDNPKLKTLILYDSKLDALPKSVEKLELINSKVADKALLADPDRLITLFGEDVLYIHTSVDKDIEERTKFICRLGARLTTRLNLTYTNFTSAQINRMLESCNQIKFLQVSKESLDEESCSLISKCTKLKALIIEMKPESESRHYSAIDLAPLVQLEKLIICGAALSEGLKNLRNLKFLSLYDCAFDGCCDDISKLEQLTQLYIYGSLSDLREGFFDECKQLKVVILCPQEGLKRFPESLKNLPELEEAHLILASDASIPEFFSKGYQIHIPIQTANKNMVEFWYFTDEMDYLRMKRTVRMQWRGT